MSIFTYRTSTHIQNKKWVRIHSNMLAVQKIRKGSLNNNNNHQRVMYSPNNHHFTNTNSYAMWQHLDYICIWCQFNNDSSYKLGPNIWTSSPLIWAPWLLIWAHDKSLVPTYELMTRLIHNNDNICYMAYDNATSITQQWL